MEIATLRGVIEMRCTYEESCQMDGNMMFVKSVRLLKSAPQQGTPVNTNNYYGEYHSIQHKTLSTHKKPDY